MLWSTISIGLLSLALVGAAHASTLQFHFRLSGESVGRSNLPDAFRAVGADSPGIAVGFDSADLLKPPPPPAGDYLLLRTSDTGAGLIADYRPLNADRPDLIFPIKLSAHAASARKTPTRITHACHR